MRLRVDPYFVLGLLATCVIGVLWVSYRGSGQSSTLDLERIQSEVASSTLAWSVGATEATVTVVEMVDLGCPVCALAHEANRHSIKAQIEAGQLHYTSFPFPLPSHPNALEAALVAHCADKQNPSGHWEAKDLLYSSQSQWNQQYPVLNLLVAALAPLDLDQGDLRHCISEAGVSYRADLMSSRLRLIYSGVDRTPFILVNGEVVAWDMVQSHVARLLE